MHKPFWYMALALLFAACDPGKSAPATDPDAASYQNLINRKKEMGVDFYALGQEPGWSLDMDMEQGFRFTTQDGQVINTPPVAGVPVMDGKATRYHAVVESGELDITVQQAPCQDIMSGRTFSHTVWGRVTFGRQDYKEFKGCGAFLIE